MREVHPPHELGTLRHPHVNGLIHDETGFPTNDPKKSEEFLLMVPYTPTYKDNMVAWMTARCDAPHYGKVIVFKFPKQKLVYGSRQIEARIDQDTVISQQVTLWQQRGSNVIRGSLLAIPIEKSILYIQSLYLAASNGQLPELKRVIVAYGNMIAMEETLDLSLRRIFGGGPMKDRELQAESKKPSASGEMTDRQAAIEALGHFRKARDTGCQPANPRKKQSIRCAQTHSISLFRSSC